MECARALQSCSKPQTFRPIFPEYSVRRLAVLLISWCYFCSLLTLCSGQGCTPVYYGPTIEFEADDVAINSTKGTKPTTVTSVKVVQGIDFTLKCTESIQHTFIWHLQDKDIASDRSFRIIPPIRAANRTGYLTVQLDVTNVKMNHSGVYKCVVGGCLDESGRPEDLNAGLNIRVISAEKPTLKFKTTVPQEPFSTADGKLIISAVVGKPASLSCIAEVIPGVTPKWRNETGISKLEMGKKCIQMNENEAVEVEQIWQKKDKKELKEITSPPCYIFNVSMPDGMKRNLTLFFPILQKYDFGEYSCGIGGGTTTDAKITLEAVVVRVKREKTQATKREPPVQFQLPNKTMIDILAVRKFKGGLNSLSVIEGNVALIYCNLTWPGPESDHYELKWTKDDLPYEQDESKNRKIDTNQTLTVITLSNVTIADRGMYKCTIYNKDRFRVSSYQYQVRVRSKVAALWPFIAICVEVVIICLIILVYEKTKSKAEVADSDTDGSPDQKNVSDNNDGASEVLRLQQKE